MFHGGNIRACCEKYKIKPEEIIDFSSNVNNFKYSEKIKNVLLENIGKINIYPDIEQKYLRKAIAEKENLEYENVILGNGSIELIYLISKYLSPNKIKVVIPTFGEYEKALKAFGSHVSYFRTREKDDFNLNINLLSEDIEDETGLFICNPNNPTGNLIESKQILELAKNLKRKKVFLVIDEAFIDFCQDKIDPFLRKKLLEEKNVFLIRSLTKFYGLAGLRLGYGLADKDLSMLLNQMQPPWNINCFAYEIALHILENKVEDQEIRDYVRSEREYMYSALSKIKCLKVFDSQANFVLIKLLHHAINIEILEEELIKSKIMVRNNKSFNLEGDNYFRIAVKDHHVNEFLIQKLKEILIM
ncbi:MAG: threonine-phosphate decarboxylase CobD [bacterium]|nr:threonine-phosphate decarboxylase CobD [bacterium]